MDDEQPRKPPEQVKHVEIPRIAPEVPELTIFSPSQKVSTQNVRTNFLQRANALHASKQPQNRNPQLPPTISPQSACRISPQLQPAKPTYNNEIPMKASVPDLSLLDPQVLIPANRMNLMRPKTTPATVVPQNHRSSSKENVFEAIVKPSVPDLTILDDEPVDVQPKKSNRMFSESYKNMLINSHEEFMKQLQEDQKQLLETAKPIAKKSNLFNTQPMKYDNPLMKYAPKPQIAARSTQDPNSSSILQFDGNVQETDEKADEMTFKKVAAMLSEIKKLVIPENSTDPTNAVELQGTSKKVDVLRHLASSYLTAEELQEFDVESELKDLEMSQEDS